MMNPLSDDGDSATQRKILRQRSQTKSPMGMYSEVKPLLSIGHHCYYGMVSHFVKKLSALQRFEMY